MCAWVRNWEAGASLVVHDSNFGSRWLSKGFVVYFAFTHSTPWFKHLDIIYIWDNLEWLVNMVFVLDFLPSDQLRFIIQNIKKNSTNTHPPISNIKNPILWMVPNMRFHHPHLGSSCAMSFRICRAASPQASCFGTQKNTSKQKQHDVIIFHSIV